MTTLFQQDQQGSMKLLSAALVLAATAIQLAITQPLGDNPWVHHLTAPAGPSRCPLVYLRDDCKPAESRSVCWSPGEPDVDCPDNQVCCFNGCSNQCGQPKERPQVVVPQLLPLPLHPPK